MFGRLRYAVEKAADSRGNEGGIEGELSLGLQPGKTVLHLELLHTHGVIASDLIHIFIKFVSERFLALKLGREYCDNYFCLLDHWHGFCFAEGRIVHLD